MFCKQCGAKIEDENAKFCPICGVDVKSETPKAKTVKEQPAKVLVPRVEIKHCRLSAVAFQQRIRYRAVADRDDHRRADDRRTRDVLCDYDSVNAAVLVISCRNIYRQYAACVGHAL